VVKQQREIITAIEEELRTSGRPRRFKVTRCFRQQRTLRIDVTQISEGKLDQSLEGGVASWNGQASVIVAVRVDDSAVYVYLDNLSLPEAATILTIKPPTFLESLLKSWQNDALAADAFSWAAHSLVGRERRDRAVQPTFSSLRARQRRAYSLLSYAAAFLWGPPGTGKTFTAASIVADLISSSSSSRVLLLAPTNVAVDQLLLAVDDQLAYSAAGQRLREHCGRIGGNFIARHYEKRRHLLPSADEQLLLQKAKLEASRPSGDDIEALAQWQFQMDQVNAALRAEVETVLRQRRVAAMTVTLATMHYSTLRDFRPFDLIVLDEASQVGRAPALMLAPLATATLIAGDPNQLAPIVSSRHRFVQRWFGQTLFDEYMDVAHPSTCFLNEQSRMAPSICRIVSDAFYGGQLRVAMDCVGNVDWNGQRQPIPLPGRRPSNVHLVHIADESEPHGGSHRRHESAATAVVIAQYLMQSVNPADILIVTPFKAQQELIRRRLTDRNLRTVRVSTIHAAQGSEKQVIIFDPVKGDSRFLVHIDNCSRLPNVAVSRAQRCFIMLLSANDRRHPILARLAAAIENDNGMRRNEGELQPIESEPPT
jgi:hypothetical protein